MSEIRKIKRSELSQVYDLVVELAVYEKEPKAVKTSLDDYLEAYDSKLIDVIVAVRDDVIIGMALYYLTFSTWRGRMLYLEDFYVSPKYRSSGTGKQIFDEFLKTAREMECTMTKWQVLDWNEKAIKFYENNGAIVERNWYNGKIIF